ncbi:MAG: lytic transglycosylase domain-containing protein [Roseburia sp.]
MKIVAVLQPKEIQNEAAVQNTQTNENFSTYMAQETKAVTGAANVEDAELASIFQEAADTYDVPVELLTAMAKQESNFRADATSAAGAMGIMQLMPATAEALGCENPYDARENIMAGAKYISQLLQKYDGDTSLALAAYNAGSGNVAKYGGIPPFAETQNYVQKVLGYMGQAASNPMTEAAESVQETATKSLSVKVSSANDVQLAMYRNIHYSQNVLELLLMEINEQQAEINEQSIQEDETGIITGGQEGVF